ncbi:hypothetical protein P170DRAFT_462938 [Aspergillus steynii IBT 23096]|uniref:Hydrophobic surface binding protein A n=1 Tax=Aspergillus steynii IBT 23096 TaxID=1392250 RepID=A0A2I2GJW0_9EURO|nr:uncharacterized protein P170DRAFT_462938 [Aspergillus steynii IBT 23096]PLB53159.1 hypothetical protein P170DRAFT_462938 [Aspergillus steynii IBT 23096]
MKLAGIVASLAIAGTASAAAIPDPVKGVVTRLDGTLGSLEGVLGNLLGGAPTENLVEIKSELRQVKVQLSQCSSSHSQRDLGNTVESVAEPVTNKAGEVVQTVKGVAGVKRQTDQLQTISEGLLQKIKGDDMDAAGLQNVLSLIQADNIPAVGGLLGILL